MFFNKKTVNTKELYQNFLSPYLDKINEDCTSEIFDSLQRENIKISKNKKEVELEVAIWLNHILGKLAGQVKIINPYSPEGLSFANELFEHLYIRWGNGENHDVFIPKIKKKYMERVKAYETYEFAYFRSEMRLDDFEACVAVILLGVDYKALTESFVKVIEELHKGSTALLYEILKSYSKKFKVLNKEETYET